MSILIDYVWDPNFQNELSSCSSIDNNNIKNNSNKLLNIQDNNTCNTCITNENDNKSIPNHLSATNVVKIFDNSKDTKEPSNWSLDELFKNKMDN